MPHRIEMFRRVERQYFRDRLGTLGLQPLDGLIIRQLGREGHLKQEELACKIAVDKGAVARSLARLEEQGLVQRQVSDQCRREKRVSLTSQGREMLAVVQQVMREWNDISYRGFSQEERALYEAFLTRITDNVMQFRRGEERDHG